VVPGRAVRPRQLHVCDDLDRDDRGWVMSVAHLVAVPEASVAEVELTPVDAAHDLVYDHAESRRLAVDSLRAEYRTFADPERLLGPEFTLLELLCLHSAISGDRLGKDTFRRHMPARIRRPSPGTTIPSCDAPHAREGDGCPQGW